MTLLAACVVLTWLSRAVLILVVPAHVMPQWLSRSLPLAAPAALAALVSTDLAAAMPASGATGGADAAAVAAATVVATLTAWRTRSIPWTVLAGVGVAGVASLIIGA